MAYLTSRDLPGRLPRAASPANPLASTLRRWATDWRSARERRRTHAILAALDPQLLDDIGVAPHKGGLDWAFVHGVAIPLPALDGPGESPVLRGRR